MNHLKLHTILQKGTAQYMGEFCLHCGEANQMTRSDSRYTCIHWVTCVDIENELGPVAHNYWQ